jgi:Carboxypeptidase regulatory-like domain
VTYTLTGVVAEVRPNGRVARDGAMVTATALGGTPVTNVAAGAVTNSDGFFSMSGLPAGVSITVSARTWEGYQAIKSLTLSGDTHVDLEIPTYTLSGVVTESATSGAVALAEVHVEDSSSHRSVSTDGQGAYSLLLGRGVAVLYVQKDGYQTRSQVPVTVNADTRFDIQLVRR